MQLHLITGQGGAGKTTLLSGLCARALADERTAVLQLGEPTLDPALLGRAGWVSVAAPWPEAGHGTPQGAMIAALGELSRERRFERVFVEVPAVVDPEALLAQLESSPALGARFRVELTFAAIDSRVAPPSEPLQARRFGAQVRSADLVLLNHCDHADELHIAAVELEVRRRSPRATITRTTRCDLDLWPVLRPLGDAPAAANDELDLPIDFVDGETSHHTGPARPLPVAPRVLRLPAGLQPPHALSPVFRAWHYETPARVLRYAALVELLERLPAGVVRAEGTCQTERGGIRVRARPSRVSLEPSQAHGCKLVFAGTHFDPELLRATLSAGAHREES